MNPSARSSSSSCSLHSKTEQVTDDGAGSGALVQEELQSFPFKPTSDSRKLFGTDSDEEPATSRVENEKGAQHVSETVAPERVRILDSQLEPPTVGYTDEGEILPAEFELSDRIELKFAVESVKSSSEAVALFAPGDLLQVETELFDEATCQDYEKNRPYSQRVIRWRVNDQGEPECNAKVVEWDDGSFSLYVEGKWYDLGQESFGQGTELLCIDQQNCLQALHAVTTGYCAIAAPAEESDEETEIVSFTEPSQMQRKPKTKRVAVLGNPVKEKEAKLKKIEQERRDKELMERKQRNLQERYILPSFDQLHDDEDDSRVHHTSTKKSRRSRAPSVRQSHDLSRHRTVPVSQGRRKKSRLDQYDDDFVEEDGDDEMELGEDYEEEELQTGTEEEETDKEETREAEQTSSASNDAETEVAPKSEEQAEEGSEPIATAQKTHHRTVVMGDEAEEDEDASE